ncbi:Fatty acyl-CoA reductase [subsurface metagenome]
MQGKIIVITGANSGIGKLTTKALAEKGPIIVMACRNLLKANRVCEIIIKETGSKRIEAMELDLGSLCSIRRFARQFSNRYRHLDVLINNAGTFCMKREETSDGFEKTMGTNYFGLFLLTHLLLQSLRKSPEARICKGALGKIIQDVV